MVFSASFRDRTIFQITQTRFGKLTDVINYYKNPREVFAGIEIMRSGSACYVYAENIRCALRIFERLIKVLPRK